MSIDCNDDQDPTNLIHREIIAKTIPPVKKPTVKQLRIKLEELSKPVSMIGHHNKNDPKVLDPVYKSEDSLYCQN